MSVLGGHLLGLEPLGPWQIQALLDLAERAARGELEPDALRGRVVANLFFEPSTRTRLSFELAARRLGAEVVNFDPERGSVQKGESLVDTALTLQAMGADVLVLRHSSSGAPHLVARHVQCSVVNAGDGMHEHPTQALLDLLTVRQAFGRVAGLRVAIVGDVLHSRVARSAAWGFSKLGAEVVLCGPPPLVPADLAGPGIVVCHRLDEALEGADVVMALRMQRERQLGGFIPSLGEYHRLYAVTPERLRLARPGALVMHPGPMNLGVEVTPEVAYGDRSLVLRQVTNGVAVRMAVLYDLLTRRQAELDVRPVEPMVLVGRL
ncbi:MAG: aspartate carbamoyltransferase catalytic subunit [Armatimonadota bacterium]|nr:aspartate carbamoyltransferase catalytic subunit [Armatimonadota bacterium]MDW8155415.1 aspartate carbamoyltransferase catalytic subunit [Armatimonadota bacterium]